MYRGRSFMRGESDFQKQLFPLQYTVQLVEISYEDSLPLVMLAIKVKQ